MHRLQSRSAIARFRLAAYLLVLGRTLLIGAICFMAFSVFVGHREHLVLASILMGVAITLIIIQWAASSRARCPLCLTPSLANKACAKNRNARSLFGSYRLRVATSIIFNNHFRCPYCNEPTVLEVRQRRLQ